LGEKDRVKRRRIGRRREGQGIGEKDREEERSVGDMLKHTCAAATLAQIQHANQVLRRILRAFPQPLGACSVHAPVAFAYSQCTPQSSLKNSRNLGAYWVMAKPLWRALSMR